MRFLCCCKFRISNFHPIFHVCLGGNTKGQKHTAEGKMEGDAQVFHIKNSQVLKETEVCCHVQLFLPYMVRFWRQLLTEFRWSATDRFCFGHSLLDSSGDLHHLCAVTCCRRNSFFCIIYRCSVEFTCLPDHWPSGHWWGEGTFWYFDIEAPCSFCISP